MGDSSSNGDEYDDGTAWLHPERLNEEYVAALSRGGSSSSSSSSGTRSHTSAQRRGRASLILNISTRLLLQMIRVLFSVVGGGAVVANLI